MKKIHNVLFALFVSAPLAAVSFGANAANIVETAAATGKFKTLITAVQAAGLADVLTGEGPFTVFAPTDDAFAQLPMGTVENLLKPENREQLVAILTYHVVSGEITSADIIGMTEADIAVAKQVDTVHGGKLSVNSMVTVQVGNATILNADIMTSNGIIHVIDTVMLPN